MSQPRNSQDILDKLPDCKDRRTVSCPAPGHTTPQGHLSLKYVGDKALVTCHQGGRHMKQHKKQFEQFKAVCLILAALILGLLIADLSGLISISAIHLALLITIIGLALAPYASKIKFAGVEFERHKEKQRRKK